ncbi:hypothetical protein [Actinophytocola sp.]|uniref:hypothetical protein n=1 Tax=Actinophytocola sp. TaxID=1872138 RepID=UPI003D6C6BBB
MVVAVVAVTTTVITGGVTTARTLVAAAIGALGEAVKTGKETNLVLDSHPRVQDTAQHISRYAEGVRIA